MFATLDTWFNQTTGRIQIKSFGGELIFHLNQHIDVDYV